MIIIIRVVRGGQFSLLKCQTDSEPAGCPRAGPAPGQTVSDRPGRTVRARQAQAGHCDWHRDLKLILVRSGSDSALERGTVTAAARAHGPVPAPGPGRVA
jgi:hypothetical protein